MRSRAPHPRVPWWFFGFLGDQLNRASLSIATNLAEGNGRFPLLELARRRGLLKAEVHETLKAQLEEIPKMLSGLIAGSE